MLFLTESGNEDVKDNMKGFSNVKVPQSPTFGNVFCVHLIIVRMDHAVIMSCLIYGWLRSSRYSGAGFDSEWCHPLT